MEGTSNTSAKYPKEYVVSKDWEALTDGEKIERMREIIKSLQSQVGQAQSSIHTLRRKLKAHEHKDGKVYEMKEITDYDDSCGLSGVATLSNPKFF